MQFFLIFLHKHLKQKLSKQSFKKSTVISKNSGVPLSSAGFNNQKIKTNLTLLVFYYISVFDETSHMLPAGSVCPLYLNILK